MMCDQHTNAVRRSQEVFADDFYVIVDFDRAQCCLQISMDLLFVFAATLSCVTAADLNANKSNN